MTARLRWHTTSRRGTCWLVLALVMLGTLSVNNVSAAIPAGCIVYDGELGNPETAAACVAAAEEAAGWPDFDPSNLANQVATTADAPTAPSWYVITDEFGKTYSPEAEAANPELADLWMGVASTENEVGSSGWYVIVGEGGKVYSPEAEAFNPEIAGLP